MSGRGISEVAQQVMCGGNGVHFVPRHHVFQNGHAGRYGGVLFKSGLMQALELLGLTDGSIYGETYHKLFGWNPRGIVLHSPEYLPVSSMVSRPRPSREEQVRTEGVQPGVGLCR